MLNRVGLRELSGLGSTALRWIELSWAALGHTGPSSADLGGKALCWITLGWALRCADLALGGRTRKEEEEETTWSSRLVNHNPVN